MIICIQPRVVAGAEWRVTFFIFLSIWDGAPLRVGALCKLRTLRIGSGDTAEINLITLYLLIVINQLSEILE